MEWMDAGDLSTQIVNLKRNHELSFSEGILINSFVQLILALHYMHSSRMLHRDLKPSNVVLTSGGLVKLADFGFSQWYETTVSGQVGNTFLGTEPYLAPEQWSRGGYSSKADVWSLGVVLYELVQLSRPFEGATTEDYQRMICSDPHPQISCSQCPPELADIINWMLRKDPKERPAVSDIMKVPWVQQRIQGWLEWVADESYVSDLVKADINLTTQRQLQVEQTPVDLRPSQDSLDYEGNVSLWLEGSNCAVRYLVLQGGRLEMVDSNVSTRGANCFILDSQYEVQLVQAHAFVLSFPDRCRAWCMVCADAQQWVEKIKRNTMAHPML
jgi:serine/threonine protein kinase